MNIIAIVTLVTVKVRLDDLSLATTDWHQATVVLDPPDDELAKMFEGVPGYGEPIRGEGIHFVQQEVIRHIRQRWPNAQTILNPVEITV